VAGAEIMSFGVLPTLFAGKLYYAEWGKLSGAMLSEKRFFREVDEMVELYERHIGSFAARTRQMIEREGRIKALSRLAVSANLQKGFMILRDRGKLDHSFEALIVKNSHLFSDKAEVVEAAKWRLDNSDKLLDDS